MKWTGLIYCIFFELDWWSCHIYIYIYYFFLAFRIDNSNTFFLNMFLPLFHHNDENMWYPEKTLVQEINADMIPRWLGHVSIKKKKKTTSGKNILPREHTSLFFKSSKWRACKRWTRNLKVVPTKSLQNHINTLMTKLKTFGGGGDYCILFLFRECGVKYTKELYLNYVPVGISLSLFYTNRLFDS